MTDPLEREVEDIARKTRVVPVTMIAAVIVALALVSAFVLGVQEDTEDGSLHDAEGVINDETMRTLEEISPVD